VCRSKHVEPLKNFGVINSITKLHLVGISIEKYSNIHNVLFSAAYIKFSHLEALEERADAKFLALRVDNHLN